MSSAQISVFDRRMRSLIIPGVPLEQLHQGSRWSEGPVYFPALDCLMWSDIPNNRLLQWVPELGVRVFSHNANHANGNTLDAQGRRVTCEHLTRSVVRIEHDGSRTVLADRHEGRRLNSPNDVVVASDGAVWFTDPSYGIMTDYEGLRSPSEQDGCYVYRICPKTGAVEARIRSMRKPNGLAFSLDETRLYVADSSYAHDETADHHVLEFPVDSAGKVGEARVFAEIGHGVPDGLRLDEFGNLWVSSARGVEVFAADGTPLGVIHVPETVANLTFGGAKNNRLFIAASSSIYAIFVAVRGARSPTPTPF